MAGQRGEARDEVTRRAFPLSLALTLAPCTCCSPESRPNLARRPSPSPARPARPASPRLAAGGPVLFTPHHGISRPTTQAVLTVPTKNFRRKHRRGFQKLKIFYFLAGRVSNFVIVYKFPPFINGYQFVSGWGHCFAQRCTAPRVATRLAAPPHPPCAPPPPIAPPSPFPPRTEALLHR